MVGYNLGGCIEGGRGGVPVHISIHIFRRLGVSLFKPLTSPLQSKIR